MRWVGYEATQTLPKLLEGIIYLRNLGFEVVRANLAFGIDWSDDENVSLVASELSKFADFYIQNPLLRSSDIMDLPMLDINHQSSRYATRHCGVGVELVAYEIDGTACSCHTLAPVSVSEDIAKKHLN